VGLAGYSKATFSSALQTSFVATVAAQLSKPASAVRVTAVADYTVGAGRRLLATGVDVTFEVDAADAADATAVTTSVTGLLASSNGATFVSALQASGVAVTGVEQLAAPATTDAAAPAAASGAHANGAAPAAMLVAALAALMLI
jgi:hypothetical protein